ncbi:MAG TPA: tetratricopeptide repeat protein [Rhodocyclaceae bacterium]
MADLIRQHLDAGLAAHRAGQLAPALAHYEQVLAIVPGEANALHLSGVALAALGRLAEGIARLEAARSQGPQAAPVHLNLANAYRDAGRHDQAVRSYQAALALKPDYADAHGNLGSLYRQLGRHSEAEASLARAVELRPELAANWFNLGNLYSDQGCHEQALAAQQQALKLAPEDGETWLALGNGLKRLNRLDQAIEALNRAAQLLPRSPLVWNSLGAACEDAGHYAPAQALYRRALALAPEDTVAAFNDACLSLRLGDYRAGWANYESRWGFSGAPRHRPEVPPWTGREPLAGRTLLLGAEQGLGDTLQFVRFARLLAAQGARILLDVPRPLAPLLRAQPWVAGASCPEDELPQSDFFCPLLSLPAAMGIDLADLPGAMPYLTLPAETQAHWQATVARHAAGRPRIGLVWSANTKSESGAARSLPLAELLAILPPQVAPFVLQTQINAAERELLAARPQVADLSAGFGDFADTAAVAAEMDLIVSVDTSVVHLAGALGLPALLLLPRVADWRWLLERADSPWYPSLELFRQQASGDWQAPLQATAARLRQRLGVG